MYWKSIIIVELNIIFMPFLLIIIALMWAYSFFRFRQKMDLAYKALEYLNHKQQNSYVSPLLLGTVQMDAQLYKDAYDSFSRAMTEFPQNKLYLEANLKFCRKPHTFAPASPKNYNKSWLHNFILVRFGYRRVPFMSQEDALELNNWIRTRITSNSVFLNSVSSNHSSRTNPAHSLIPAP